MKNIACIILAAGRGTRMKSEVPKVLQKVHSRPLLSFILEAYDAELKRSTPTPYVSKAPPATPPDTEAPREESKSEEDKSKPEEDKSKPEEDTGDIQL